MEVLHGFIQPPGDNVKALHLAHMAVTALLLASVAVIAALFFAGVVEVRHTPASAAADPYPALRAPGTKARLLVLRGLQPNWEYPLYEGRNILGRADEQPVDIDLQPQEAEERIWSSRQHAAITCERGAMVIEDLNSANGTYVNRRRVPPGERRTLAEGDIIQVGAVQLKVLR